MLDFMMVTMRSPKRGTVEIYPKFIIGSSKDLMIRGGDFYAIWNEELGLWSTSEDDAQRLNEIDLSNNENTLAALCVVGAVSCGRRYKNVSLQS